MLPSTFILSREVFADGLRVDAIFHHPDRPLEVDIGCGKGRFLTTRATRFPTTNFLGVDRLIHRLRRVDRRLQRLGIPNVRLLHFDAFHIVEFLLPVASVDIFYVFFPDPWPKRRHHRRRLLNGDFLDALHRALRPDGRVHFATDHLAYFEVTRKVMASDARFEVVPPFIPTEEEKTNFQVLFEGKGLDIRRLSLRRLP